MLVYDYIDVTQFDYYMFVFCIIFKTFLTLQFNRRNTVYFKMMCAACGTFWNRFGAVSVHQLALWWVCVGII